MKVYQTKLEEADYKAINKWHPSLNGKLEMAYLIYGEAMNLIVGRVEPGTEFSDDPPHDVEEILFILQGKCVYKDGRVVTGGMATINLAGQPHGGRFESDDPNDPNKPCIFVEVAATPKLKEHLKEFKVIAKREE